MCGQKESYTLLLPLLRRLTTYIAGKLTPILMQGRQSTSFIAIQSKIVASLKHNSIKLQFNTCHIYVFTSN